MTVQMTQRKEEGEINDNVAEKYESKQLSGAEQERRTLHHSNQLQRLIISLFIFTIIAWLFGRYDVSLVWVFALLAWIFLWWKNTATRVIDLAAKEAEINKRRQRALSHAETAEWLNFLVNRW